MLKIEPTDATCNACIIASLIISVTTIAESAMSLRLLTLLTHELHTAIGGVRDLCIVQCCCLLDLLFDDSKRVHLSLPEILGWKLTFSAFAGSVFSRSFSRLRPSNDHTQAQIPLRSLPILLPLWVIVLICSFGSWRSMHQHQNTSCLNRVVNQTWDERSVPRLTCVLCIHPVTFTWHFWF